MITIFIASYIFVFRRREARRPFRRWVFVAVKPEGLSDYRQGCNPCILLRRKRRNPEKVTGCSVGPSGLSCLRPLQGLHPCLWSCRPFGAGSRPCIFRFLTFGAEYYILSAISIARRRAPSLLFTSCSSYSSLLFATMPPPAWNHSSPLRETKVRMVMAWLSEPSRPM